MDASLHTTPSNQPQQTKYGHSHSSPYWLPLTRSISAMHVKVVVTGGTGSLGFITKRGLWSPWKPTNQKYHSWTSAPRKKQQIVWGKVQWQDTQREGEDTRYRAANLTKRQQSFKNCLGHTMIVSQRLHGYQQPIWRTQEQWRAQTIHTSLTWSQITSP